MRRVAAFLLLAIGTLVVYQPRHESDGILSTTEEPRQRSGQAQAAVELAPLQPLPAGADATASTRQGDEGSLRSEARDPEWAPETKATLDSVIRSMGGTVWDVRGLQCHATHCEAIIIHNPSLIDADRSARTEATSRFEQDLRAVLGPVLLASPRLESISVSDMYSIVSGVPNEVVFDQLMATRVTISVAAEYR